MLRLLGFGAAAVCGAVGTAGAAIVCAAHFDSAEAPVVAARSAVLSTTAAAARAYLHTVHSVRVTGAVGTLHELLRDRSTGVLTVSNHACAFDDPMLIAELAPPDVVADPAKMRVVLCAREMCFASLLPASYFQLGNVVPVDRGAGLDQPSVHLGSALLAAGGWVHMFPEGKIFQDRVLGKLRFGPAHMAATAAASVASDPPAHLDQSRRASRIAIVPFYARGMANVKRMRRPPSLTPARVEVIVGEPVWLEPGTSARRVHGLIHASLSELAESMEELYPFADVDNPPGPSSRTSTP